MKASHSNETHHFWGRGTYSGKIRTLVRLKKRLLGLSQNVFAGQNCCGTYLPSPASSIKVKQDVKLQKVKTSQLRASSSVLHCRPAKSFKTSKSGTWNCLHDSSTDLSQLCPASLSLVRLQCHPAPDTFDKGMQLAGHVVGALAGGGGGGEVPVGAKSVKPREMKPWVKPHLFAGIFMLGKRFIPGFLNVAKWSSQPSEIWQPSKRIWVQYVFPKRHLVA